MVWCQIPMRCYRSLFVDESCSVCSSGQIKLLAIGINLLIYSVALVSAIHLVFFRDSESMRETLIDATLTNQQKAQITTALKLIKTYVHIQS